MDPKTLKIKAIDTEYRQIEPTIRKGKRINLVHVDDNMYSVDRDTFNEQTALPYEDHKTLDSAEQITDVHR